MKPTPRPGRPISEMGCRIQDLMDMGWSATKIAHHCGCDKNTIMNTLADPGSDPRFVTGELLIELHEHVMMGESKWARMIRELVLYHRMTFREVAGQCGVTVNYLRYGFIYNHKKMPRHKLGAALTRLHQLKERERQSPHWPAPPAYVKFMQEIGHELDRRTDRPTVGRRARDGEGKAQADLGTGKAVGRSERGHRKDPATDAGPAKQGDA